MTAKIAKIYGTIVSMMLAIGIFSPIVPVLANPSTKEIPVNSVTVLTGTIHKLAVEGTCYQLVTDNGDKYELMGKFPKIDGKRLRVRGVATDLVTICQVGKPFKVNAAKVIQ